MRLAGWDMEILIAKPFQFGLNYNIVVKHKI